MTPERVASSKRGRVRPIAIAVIQDRGRLFVAEGHDPIKDETFYRPLGGGIEFGESAADALRREFREEMGQELAELRLLGVLENLFTFAGEPGHEIVLVFGARFADTALCEKTVIRCREDSGEEFTGLWLHLESVRTGNVLLYPDGLLDLVRRTTRNGPVS